ncbi:MAG: ABC transporter permease [bacterium]|nr:ABC transporter permease [bacterium]
MKHAFAVALAFVRKDFLEETSYRLQFAINGLVVALQLVFLFLLSDFVGAVVEERADFRGRYFDFVVMGICAVTFLNTALAVLNRRIRRAQTVGTLEALLSTRTPLAVIVASLPAYSLLTAALTSATYLALGWLFFDLPLQASGVAAAAVILSLMVVAFGCVGMITAGLTIAFKRADFVERAFSLSSVFLGGVWFPVDSWPEWVQWGARLLPITPALQGLRATLLGGAGLSEVTDQLQHLGLFIAVMLPVGALVFRWTLRRAMHDGTLTQY